MLATVVWIGSLAALSILVLPATRKALDAHAYAALIETIQRRLDPLGWLCLVLLVATGLVQMSANPNYRGFLAITNRWAVAILIKHIVFAGMTAVSAYLTWGLLPALAARRIVASARSGGRRRRAPAQPGTDFIAPQSDPGIPGSGADRPGACFLTPTIGPTVQFVCVPYSPRCNPGRTSLTTAEKTSKAIAPRVKVSGSPR